MNTHVSEQLGLLIEELQLSGAIFKNKVTVENILKSFEDCLSDEYKKEKGIVYTPEYIANVMVRRAIEQWIINIFGINYNDIIEHGELERITLLKDKLSKVKVLDPCVGAGVYPFSILNVLEEMIVKINSLLNVQERKIDIHTRIIKDNIYAVDIDENAVKITKFRLWAHLCDLGYTGDIDDISCNILHGNTLNNCYLGSKMIYNRDLSDFKGNAIGYEEEWEELWKEYTDNRTDNNKLKMINMALEMSAAETGDTPKKFNIRALKMKNKLSNQAILQLEFLDIFTENTGFDIFIGNPPYVSSGNMTEDKDDLAKLFPNVACGTADLCLYFFEKGDQVTNNKGIVSLITSNKWIDADYGYNFRKWITDKNNKDWNCIHIADFKTLKVFENAGVDVAITTLNKNIKTNTIQYIDISRYADNTEDEEGEE